MSDTDTTIAAICTPPGNSTTGIIRLSGIDTFAILSKICLPGTTLPNSRCVIPLTIKITLCDITKPFTIDCIAYLMPGPASYTRQDVAELILPGAPPLLRRVLTILCENGARLADGGEFTLRAFLSGRIGLGEAEAVERLVSASEESQRRDALDRLNSGLSEHITQWRNRLRAVAAQLEASLDFAEEDTGDIENKLLKESILQISSECRSLCEKARRKRGEDGALRITLAGLTNAGKSSLINALSDSNDTIVSAERSTTRDRLDKPVTIDRFRFILEDCPGIDFQTSTFSDLASEQARNNFARSHLLMLVIDTSVAPDEEFTKFLRILPPLPAIIVFNKADLSPAASQQEEYKQVIKENSSIIETEYCALSASTGVGLEELRNILIRQAYADIEQSNGLLTLREETEIATAAIRCEEAANALALGAEIAALELRGAYEAFSRACGEGYGEDILQSVFSHFCIGK